MTTSTPHLPSIRSLPDDVRAQIRSSSTLNSLNDVVIGLLKNALDASARNIKINLDYVRGACTVLDDGVGIPAAAFAEDGGLGELYHTSKFPPSSQIYGRHGLFLASVSAVSFLTISSRLSGHLRQPLISMNPSRTILRLEDAQNSKLFAAQQHGASVSVQALFGNLPVRVKQRVGRYEDSENKRRDFEELKRLVVGLLLASSRPCRVAITTKGEERRVTIRDPRLASETSAVPSITGQSSFHFESIVSILAQGGYMPSPSAKSWSTISARSSFASIRACISLDPTPSKQTQFVSIGIIPIDHRSDSIIHSEINKLFTMSSFGMKENDFDVDQEEQYKRAHDKRFKGDMFTNRQLKGAGRGVDRWPAFYIRIDMERDRRREQSLNIADAISVNETHSIIELLRSMIIQFLEQHHFRPRSYKRKKSCLYDLNNGEDGRLAGQKIAETSYVRQRYSPKSSSEVKKAFNSSTELDQKPCAPVLRRTKPELVRQDFSTWSRIKISSPVVLADLSFNSSRSKPVAVPRESSEPSTSVNSHNARSPPSSPALIDSIHPIEKQDSRDQTIDAPMTCRKQYVEDQGSRCSTFNQSNRTGTGNEPQDTAAPKPDGEIKWTNPLTSHEVRINARTGSILRDQSRSDQDPMSATKSARIRTKFRGLRLLPRQSCSRMQSSPKGTFASEILREWSNPVFHHSEVPIPAISIKDICESPDEQPFPTSTAGKMNRSLVESLNPKTAHLDKCNLATATVLGQIDRKFILIKLRASQISTSGLEETLVLIDQHAADERCRVERLFQDLFQFFEESSNELTGSPLINSSLLPQPVVFETSRQEIELFQSHQPFFSSWGIIYKIDTQSSTEDAVESRLSSVTVTAVPSLIAERCRLDHKVVIDLLRREIWVLAEDPQAAHPAKPTGIDWPARIASCPKSIIEMLCSRACRSAIMFNDPLTIEECKRLVRNLADCKFPFICAHGRKSMVVLGGLDCVGLEQEETGSKAFVEQYRQWQGL